MAGDRSNRSNGGEVGCGEERKCYAATKVQIKGTQLTVKKNKSTVFKSPAPSVTDVWGNVLEESIIQGGGGFCSLPKLSSLCVRLEVSRTSRGVLERVLAVADLISSPT